MPVKIMTYNLINFNIAEFIGIFNEYNNNVNPNLWI